jgi:hypothetical protein
METKKFLIAESLIHVRSIAFRPDESFKKRFKSIPLKRSKEKRHSNPYSAIEIDGLLTGYFLDNAHITRRAFCSLCGLTETTGKRRLRQLVAEGKLRKTGYANLPLYEPVKGNYRR